MIEQEFDQSSIISIQFGVTFTNGASYLVAVDKSVDGAFRDMLSRTSAGIISREGDWEEYSLSQSYGDTERVYITKSDPIFKVLSDLYEI
ncbi:hypothetical protein FV222_07735 [Methylobacterium sp. WL103]|uniref:hypothetical protein n=1 Tax=Methylobacterium sp. WL103 TaxID=2603891 RepID=UPI0011C81A73|nr:hypothetical protein [Methylobacterium sp. WL103]TXN04291.1 hypothetical protein FV222_07735 [Methylobacterium sp. WL103]